jgi:hypothetical protein
MVQERGNTNGSSNETAAPLVLDGVNQILKQLVEHFNQPVHDDVLSGDPVGEGNANDPLSSPPPPYFDPLLGMKPELLPVVQFWLDRLFSTISTTTTHQPNNETAAMIGIVEWITGYESSIRPFLLQSAVGCSTMLQQYELILSEWLSHQITQEQQQRQTSKKSLSEETCSEEMVEVESYNKDPTVSGVPTITNPLPQQQQLFRTIEILSTDITLMTSERYFPKFSPYVRSNIILPTLLQILDRVLETVRHIFSMLGHESVISASPAVPQHLTDVGSGRRDNSSSFRRCFISLLAFDGTTMAPPAVAPTTLTVDGLPCGGIESVCYYPPLNWQHHEVQTFDRQYFSFDSIDWNSVTLSTSVWNDPKTGIVLRAVDRIWSQLGSLLLGGEQFEVQQEIQQSGDDTNTNVTNNNSNNPDHPTEQHLHQNNRRSQRQAIVRVLGFRPLLEDIRKHFFGRDMVGWEPQLHTSQQVVLGRRVTKSRPVVDEKPYQAIPSRVVVTLNFLRLLDQADEDVDDPIIAWSNQKMIVDNLLPIFSTLLDSTSATFVALGASGMLEIVNLLDRKAGRTILHDGTDEHHHPLEGGESRNSTNSELSWWRTLVDDGLDALERAFQSSHDGPVIVTIGQAQSKLLMHTHQLRNHYPTHQWANRRRRITGQWLFRLQRISHRPVTMSLCGELLVGGIVPLLLQHTMNATTTTAAGTTTRTIAADSMEMGRLGLSALLPLIGGDYDVDDKTLVLAMVGLINLLGGAYPIMCNHGGKIICHALAAIATIINNTKTKDDSSFLLKKNLAVHTGAVAAVICGPKFTTAILDDVLNNNNTSNGGSQYLECLIEAAIQVRELAGSLSK